jgi:hypothetical protein
MGTERKVGVQFDWRPAKRPRPIDLRGLHVVARPVVANDDAEQLYAASHPPVGDAALWTYLPDGPYRDPGDFRDALVLAESSEDPLFFTLARLPGEHPAGIASYLRITPLHGVIEDRPHLVWSVFATDNGGE